MSTVSVADAWSLAPIGELRLGDRVVPVPPLTFGRFQRLIASEYASAIARLVERDVAAVATVAAAVVPGITEEEWRENASTVTFCHLFQLFAANHDWPFIAEAIRLGEPVEPGESLPSLPEVVAGLMAVARESGETVEGLTEMRVEGFYLLVEAIRAKRAPTETAIPLGLDYVPEGEGAHLLDLLKSAEEAGRG